MATPAQKHFRKEMKELNRSSQPFGQTDIYQPAFKSRRSKPRWSYSLIAIVLVLTLLSGMPKQFYNNFIVYKHDKMITYLQEQQAYTEQSAAILNTYLIQSSTPASLNINALQESKKSLNNLILEANNMKAPSAFKEHKNSVIEIMEKRLFIVTYIEVLASSSSQNYNELTPHINELNTRQQLERNQLAGIFEEEDIPYILEDDGSIRYEYKTYRPMKWDI